MITPLIVLCAAAIGYVIGYIGHKLGTPLPILIMLGWLVGICIAYFF